MINHVLSHGGDQGGGPQEYPQDNSQTENTIRDILSIVDKLIEDLANDNIRTKFNTLVEAGKLYASQDLGAKKVELQNSICNAINSILQLKKETPILEVFAIIIQFFQNTLGDDKRTGMRNSIYRGTCDILKEDIRNYGEVQQQVIISQMIALLSSRYNSRDLLETLYLKIQESGNNKKMCHTQEYEQMIQAYIVGMDQVKLWIDYLDKSIEKSREKTLYVRNSRVVYTKGESSS